MYIPVVEKRDLLTRRIFINRCESRFILGSINPSAQAERTVQRGKKTKASRKSVLWDTFIAGPTTRLVTFGFSSFYAPVSYAETLNGITDRKRFRLTEKLPPRGRTRWNGIGKINPKTRERMIKVLFPSFDKFPPLFQHSSLTRVFVRMFPRLKLKFVLINQLDLTTSSRNQVSRDDSEY